MLTPLDHVEAIRWHPFLNNSGETVPAWAVLRVESLDGETGLYTLRKPNADSQLNVVFNGPTDVPTGGYGACTRDYPATVLYDAADGTPAADQEWGAGNGSFKLRKGKAGFRIIGGVVAADTRVEVAAMGGGGTDPSAVVQVTSERVSTVYYRSYKGTQFNEPTRSFASKEEILVLDAQDIGFPP